MVLMHGGGKSTIDRKLIDLENGNDDVSSGSFVDQILRVLEERDSKWILGLITYNVVIVYYLCSWVTSTNSIALRAYANTIFFNVFALLVCLISIWVEQNSLENRKFAENAKTRTIFDNSRGRVVSRCSEYRTCFTTGLSRTFTKIEDATDSRDVAHRHGNCVKSTEKFVATTSNDEAVDRNSITVLGLERYEVIALLVSSCLSLVAGSLVSVEVVARLTDQPSVHTGRLGLGAFLGFLAHLGTIMAYPDAGLNHVVCKALPCPTVRGCNPILGGNMVGAVILSGTHLVIHFWDIHITDTAAALAVIGLTATSMLPLAFYTLNVMLQKLPRHMSEQLDKCIREALIIDGVLEFRNERFWTKSFGKLAGTLQVRIRRNANENHVLNSVVKRLSMIVSTLTVQEFRESRMHEQSIDHPIEYYINEILPTNVRANRLADKSSSGKIDDNARVMRIEDILGSSDSRVRTIVEQSEKSVKSFESTVGSFEQRSTNVRCCEVVARTLTVYENDNVRFKDRLYRVDAVTNNNALLSGMRLDFERFDNHFFSHDREKISATEKKL